MKQLVMAGVVALVPAGCGGLTWDRRYGLTYRLVGPV
jgi:hypothetical protein